MYMPPPNKEQDEARIRAAIETIGFGHLVSTVEGRLFSTPMPFLLEADGKALTGHVAKANPHWRAGAGPALAIFQGPQTYISPSHYPTKQETGRVVPTWNYVVIHASGPVFFTEDAGFLRDIVTRLTQRHESPRPAPWAVTDAPEDFIAAQLRGIVGVRLEIETLEGKWKMSQNRNAADRAGVIAGLEAEGAPAAARLVPPP